MTKLASVWRPKQQNLNVANWLRFHRPVQFSGSRSLRAGATDAAKKWPSVRSGDAPARTKTRYTLGPMGARLLPLPVKPGGQPGMGRMRFGHRAQSIVLLELQQHLPKGSCHHRGIRRQESPLQSHSERDCCHFDGSVDCWIVDALEGGLPRNMAIECPLPSIGMSLAKGASNDGQHFSN